MLEKVSIRIFAMFVVLSSTLVAGKASSFREGVIDHGFRIPAVPNGAIPSNYRMQTVTFATQYPVGTIIVEPSKRYLYLVRGGGRADRYGVSVGAAAFAWSGEARVERKAVWPSWTPTNDMVARDRTLSPYVNGVAPGPTNPMGARALYLYKDGRDTLYRIHGTSEYWSIGKASSSGCIRMLNTDILELYDEVPVGTKVVVLPARNGLKWHKRAD